MPNIQINIKNKVARADRAIIVCDNSDYTAVFDFDDEWSAYETKTARFVYGGTYTDVVFTGNSCPIPVIQDARSLSVGVYAGDLHTTTPAYISCVPSILFGNGIPADPTPDVYNQIMELLNKESGIWYPAVDDAGNMSWTRSISETAPQPVNIKGSKGDVGAQGETGPQGPKGDTGATGPQGPKGDTGANGKDGMDGKDGADGQDGSPGADGKDGVDGKSAYELAQDNGFQGTMQEWLASLVGADGANGVDGKDGISPAVSVAAITGGNRVTITDAEGAKTFDVMNGAQGASGADGKDYVLTNTDKQEIAKTAAGLVDVPSVQSDWNQNDSTAADYVKNRPFYTGDPVETVLVEESTVEFTEDRGQYGAFFPTSFNAEFGATYKVSWDGSIYTCVCKNINNWPIIGNPSMLGFSSDTGEPFIIFNKEGLLETGWISATTDTSASHTISISSFTGGIVKIDEKYLPDSIISEISTAQSTANAAQSAAENAQTTAETAKTTAETAKTTADTAKTTADTAKTTADTAKTTADTAKSTADTAKSTAEAIKPDWGEADQSSKKYIANRPCYIDRQEKESPLDIASSNTHYEGSDLYWFGSFYPQTTAAKVEYGGFYRFSDEETVHKCFSYRTGGNTYNYYDIIGNAALVADALALVADGFGNPILDTGEDWAYVTQCNSLSSSIFSRTQNYKQNAHIVTVSETVKQLDERMIPDTIPRKADTILSAPQTLTDTQKQQTRANIGLTPVAKTGAMTQSVGLDAKTGRLWTVPPTGDNIVLASSTTGSTKKFRITVDDSGAITATEVS